MKRLLIILALILIFPLQAFAGCEHFTRLYGTAATVPFCLWKTDGTAFQPTITFANGDVKVSKDEGSDASCTTSSGVCVVAVGSLGCWKLTLTNTEMTAARVRVSIVNASALNKCVEIDTFGNASAQFGVATDANIVQIGGDAQSESDLKDFVDTGYDPSTHKVQGVVTVDTTTNLTNGAVSISRRW